MQNNGTEEVGERALTLWSESLHNLYLCDMIKAAANLCYKSKTGWKFIQLMLPQNIIRLLMHVKGRLYAPRLIILMIYGNETQSIF